MANFKIVIQYRNSVTGYYCSPEYAKDNPDTTQRITLKVKK